MRRQHNNLYIKRYQTNHGYGLQSVQKAIDKYNGVMRLKQEENFFIVDVTLYNAAPIEEYEKL